MPRKKRHFLEYLPDLEKTGDHTFVYKKKLEVSSNDLKQLSPLFNDKEVFLVGSGPSINKQKLSNIEQYPTIFVNGSITLVETHQLKPTAYMVVDKSFIQNHTSLLDLIPPETPCIFTIGVIRQVLAVQPDFFENHPLFFIEKATKRYNLPAVNSEELPDNLFIKKQSVACSLDMTHGFVEAGTVMYVAAQLMLSFSAKKVTLVGFDLGNADKPRFYEKAHNKVKSGLKKAIYNRIIPSFELLAEIYNQHGIQLSNASHLSSMPYDIIPFNDILMPKRETPDND